MSKPQDWAFRQLSRRVLTDLRRVGGQLVLTDLALRLVTFAITAPFVAFVLNWFLRSGGRSGAVADHSILFFFLSPVGFATILVVGSLAAAVYFAGLGALTVIVVGHLAGHEIWPRGAVAVLVREFRRLVLMAARAIVRVLAIVALPLAFSAVVYGLLLTRHDIYFYLTVKPREFWIAAALIGLALGVGAVFVLRRLLRWVFAIPILLFEGASARQALSESRRRTVGRMRPLLFWHAGWLAGSLVIGTAGTFVVGLLGRLLIRPESGLAAVAIGAGIVAALGFVVQMATATLSIGIYAALLGRLYWPTRPPDVPTGPMERLQRLDGARWHIRRERVAWAGAIAGVIGLAVLTTNLVNRVAIDPAADVTAHRGAKLEAPENTIPAIERAIELGADWVEIDVQLTADDRVIVVHDRDFNRVAGTGIRAEESVLAELVTLDVGSWFGSAFAGTPPPTLEEVLRLCRGRIGVNVELKYFGPDRGLAPRVIELVDRYDMADDVMLMSFDHARMAEASALRPDLEVGLLIAVALGNALELEADFYAVPPSMATRRFIRAAQARGRDVHVWTVDDPVRISAMLSRGADNLYTGSTGIVRRVLRDRAALGPIERLLIDIAADLGVIRLPPAAPATEEDA
jgi:glycerophosphoryl diester phosphodiesterase